MLEDFKVLVVDTDKDVRFLIKMYFRDYNVTVLEAADYESCKKTLDLETPQILIVNYMLNRVSGYQIAREISEKKDLVKPEVIIMTLEGFDLIDEAIGISEYLAKPFSREQFMATVMKTASGNNLSAYKKQIEPTSSSNISVKPEKQETSDLYRKKILVVDDDLTIIKLIKLILEKDYELDFAYSGSELVEKVSENAYDLIISDVVMPQLSGWKSVKKIRESGCNTPVVFNSGLVNDQELYETLKPEGRSCFLLKPFKREQLLKAVAELTS